MFPYPVHLVVRSMKLNSTSNKNRHHTLASGNIYFTTLFGFLVFIFLIYIVFNLVIQIKSFLEVEKNKPDKAFLCYSLCPFPVTYLSTKIKDPIEYSPWDKPAYT